MIPRLLAMAKALALAMAMVRALVTAVAVAVALALALARALALALAMAVVIAMAVAMAVAMALALATAVMAMALVTGVAMVVAVALATGAVKMNELDTSAEAVERLARAMDGTVKWHPGVLTLAAFTLRALVAERDMWRDRLTKAEAQAVRDITDAYAERDMWRAENIKKQEACEQMGRRIAALEAEVAVREQAARRDGMEKAAKLHDEWARDEWSAAHQCNQWAHTPAEHGRHVSNARRHEASAAAIRAAARDGRDE